MPNCPLTLRIIKGSKLNFAELDGNFISLSNCITTLENNLYTNFLPLSGNNYTIIKGNKTPSENGQDLYDVYTNNIGITPNGQPLSEENRWTILLGPGIYDLPAQILWSVDFIDLACFGGVANITFLSGTPLSTITANDTQFSNIRLNTPYVSISSGWSIAFNKAKVILNNCSGYYTYPSGAIASEEFTVNRNYQETSVSRKIYQNCLETLFNLYFSDDRVDVEPNGVSRTLFPFSLTNNVSYSSNIDIFPSASIIYKDPQTNPSLEPFSTIFISDTGPITSTKYILMTISNVVGTFSVNDVVDQGGTTGIITETDGITYFVAYVATGTFPNGIGSITNTTSGGSADNNGWSIFGAQIQTIFSYPQVEPIYSTFMNNNLTVASIFNTYVVALRIGLAVPSHLYIEYDGPNTSFSPNSGANTIYNELGGTATPQFSNNSGTIVISDLNGQWAGATQVWNNVNTTPVTITNRSQYIIHTLTNTSTNV